MKPETARRGFTLIELLIVVAIIAILAAIAVPNFLEAQMRAKVSRVRSDMRSIVVALESYFVDSNAYPPHSDDPAGRPWWRALTTPVAYITSVPLDPFNNPFPGRPDTQFGPYMHYNPFWNTFGSDTTPGYAWMPDWWGPWPGFVAQMRARGLWYCLESLGPDGDEDIPSNSAGPGAFYDPTNGTVSNGDIIRFGPGSSDYVRL